MFNAEMEELPAQLLAPERAMLYALVFGLRPRRILEIGTAQGGSAIIMARALDAVGHGKIVTIDPQELVRPEHRAMLVSRATLIVGFSPTVVPQAREIAGGPFDFVFIDAMHERHLVSADVAAVLPVMADGAYLLFHDANYSGVASAIDDAVAKHGLIDCGVLSRAGSPDPGNPNVMWAGLRLLRRGQTNQPETPR